MRGFAFAAALGLGVLLSAPLAAQAASDGPEIALAKRLMKFTGDTDAMRAEVPHIAKLEAAQFASGAVDADVVVNQKALDRAVKIQVKKYGPQFINADAQAFAKAYTAEELRQYIAWFKKRESRRGKLPKALEAKAEALAQARSDTLSPLRPKLAKDLFAAYCTGRVACGPAVQKLVAGYGHL